MTRQINQREPGIFEKSFVRAGLDFSVAAQIETEI
jgi:hypothetical protein